MNRLSVPIPRNLPGVDIEFGLKQCLGKPELLQGLLHRFWEDYKDSWGDLKELDGYLEKQSWIIHDVKGAADNLGLNELTHICQELKQDLTVSNHLGEEPIERYHMELEKVGGSIKKLDSFLES